MDLLAYKNSMQNLPMPTIGQTENFIDFVANNHSWYKHLPEERLEPFIFYLDPNAGKILERIEEKEIFNNKKHYCFKEMSSPNYQTSYGTWQYYTNCYSVNFIPNSDGSISDTRPLIGLNIINIEGEAIEIPEEVINHGRFMMSLFLHKRAFENAHNYSDENGISFAENHKIIISELKQHLYSFLNFIYDK